ncbi:MAG: T9SS type A sorting domain-containing protein [Chitinophagales bacterium]
MKKLFLWLLLCTLSVSAQNTFYGAYDIMQQKEEGWDISVWNDGSLIILSGELCSHPDGLNDCNGFIRINAENEEVWESIYDPYPHGATSAYKGFLRFNESLFVVGYEGTDLHKYDAMLQKINPDNGEVEWTKLYTIGDDSDFIDRAIKTKEGDIMMVGGFGNAENQSFDMLLLKTDSLGNELWHKILHSQEERDQLRSALLLPSGNILIGGGGYKFDEDLEFDGYFAKIDSDGNILYEKIFGGDKEHGYLLISDYIEDDILIRSAYDTLTSTAPATPYSSPYNTTPYVARADTLGNIKWQYFFTADYFKGTWDVEHDEAGNVYVCGKDSNIPDSIRYDFFPNNDVRSESGFIAKLDSSGNLLWERQYMMYKSLNLEHFKNIALTPQGQIAATGMVFIDTPDDTTDYYTNLHHNLWLVKTDLDGCITPGCEDRYIILGYTDSIANYVDTVGGVGFVPQLEQKHFFLPQLSGGAMEARFYNAVYRESSYLNVYNLNGQRVARESLPLGTTTLQFNTVNFPQGIYIVEYEAAGKALQREKYVLSR